MITPRIVEVMILRLVAILCSVLLATAAFMPWQEQDYRYAPGNIISLLLLLSALVSLGFALYESVKRTNLFGWVYTSSAVIGLAIVSYSIVQAGLGPGTETIFSILHIGAVFLAAFASLGLLIVGILNLKKSGNNSNGGGSVADFIANRIAFNQQKSFSRFIIRLSIVATVISVAVMIITLAFANGFQEKVSQKVFSFWGHIRIQEMQPDKSLIAEETPIDGNDTLVEVIKKDPRVKTIHPFATKYAILKTKDEIEGVLVKGFDSTYDFNHFSPFLKEGRPIRFNDSSYSRDILISAYTAEQLKLKVNDRILIYFVRPNGADEFGVNIRPDKLTVAGIYKTGIEEYDKTFAIGDIKLIRD